METTADDNMSMPMMTTNGNRSKNTTTITPRRLISVSSAFDGGNGKFIKSLPNELDPAVTDVLIYIRPDVYTELEQIAHMQYFCFRVTISGATPVKCRYVLENAHAVSYPEAWPGTTVCYGPDVNDVDGWKRCTDTTYQDGKLVWEFEHVGSLYFAFFPPYTYQRHLQLISVCQQQQPKATVHSLGQSLEGRDIECIQIGHGERICWIIHRQHPGETMAEHYAEGLLYRLLSIGRDESAEPDPVVLEALDKYTFFIVPCMCPDGVVRGHLRTNACGANLNREWATKGGYEAPTLERSPEVYAVLHTMINTGCDCFVDIHGDEELPFNFLAGANHIPGWGPRLQALHGAFAAAYERSNRDLQLEIGYPPPESPAEVLHYMNVATNQVSQRFDCLGITLEMPFKDCLTNSDPEHGWTAAKSRQLGASLLEALLYVHPYLRDPTPFWTRLPLEDRYVETTDDYQHLSSNTETAGTDFIRLQKRFYSDVHEIHKAPAVREPQPATTTAATAAAAAASTDDILVEESESHD